MSEYNSKMFKNFIRGISAVSDRYGQPPGSVPRASNLIMTKRGALVTCDGTQLVHAFNGTPTPNRGKIMSGMFFSPLGVSSYYLTIQKILDVFLGRPFNLSVADAGPGGGLSGDVFYKVTALDGAGGETDASDEATINLAAGHRAVLTWNIVPNAQAYKIYRSFVTNTEILLVSLTLPVPQPAIGTLTVTFTDDGIATSVVNSTLTTASPFGAVVSQDGTTVTWTTTSPHNLKAGFTVDCTNAGIPALTGTYKIISVPTTTSFITDNHNNVPASSGGGPGVVTASGGVPLTDTTQQCALFKMPVISGVTSLLPVPYSDSDIVALYPADILPSPDGGAGGGTGGGGIGGSGGTGGSGGGATGGGTPSGGVLGNISFIPEIVQFSNRAVLALGNGFPAQLFSDPNTLDNPATTSTITNISVDAFGVVTVTVSGGHGIPAGAVGANVVISGTVNYNGVFPTIQIVSTTVFKVRNISAIGSGAEASGTVTTTSMPLISTFTQGFPVWATGVTYLVGDLIQPTVANGHYYKCIQGGISAAAQPTFPTSTGGQVQEASPSKVIWQEAGLTNSNAPPPPGIAHVKVYAGSLWAWNTSVTNTANGLDGPTCLRMSDANNPNSWNPINQAFLDKDDGTEGSGLHAFTISGFGIPPEGSLVAFKQYAGYQIVGVFGSQSFLIQRIKSSLGCIAPRTLQFTTGFGLCRFTHLGFAVFDGMNDRIIDEDIHPYIFPANEITLSDITTVDFSWMSLSWATQTSYPAMYIAAFPIGDSNGQLTRLFCHDLVLKSWVIVDLPFPIGTCFQGFSDIAVPVTILGTFYDGSLHRWQAGDEQWDLYIDANGNLVPHTDVNFNVETPTVFNERSQGGRIYCRQLVIVGAFTSDSAALALSVALELQGETARTVNGQLTQFDSGLFALNTPVGEKCPNLDAIISGSGAIELNSFDFQIKPEVATVPGRLT